MKRGVIMELRDDTAVLMDGTGDIVSVPVHTGWRVGDTVEFPRRKNHGGRWGALAAALVLIVAGGIFGKLYLTAYSLVSLDVNPSVELTLNRFDRVISARAMNDEGARLLQASAVEQKTAPEAMNALLGGAYLTAYLGDDAVVSMTVQSSSPDRERELLGMMDAVVERELCANYQDLQVDCVAVDGATVERAHGCGVTAGKYLALMELKAADPGVDIDDYTHCGIGEIKAETERCHRDNGVAEPDGFEVCPNGQESGGSHHHGGEHE